MGDCRLGGAFAPARSCLHGTISPLLLQASTAVITTLVGLTLVGAATAQTYTGTDVTSGPFTSGVQSFRDNSRLDASAANAISGGMQAFNDNSVLNASASNAVNGGTQAFSSSATLNAAAANAVSDGEQIFWGVSALNASSANAVGGGYQSFFDTSTLNASSADAISGGLQEFNDVSTLNASTAGAISGGEQQFHGMSVLYATAAGAITGGIQDFAGSSVLNAAASNAVNGGIQAFGYNSILNASAANAVRRGQISLAESASVQVHAADALTNNVAITFNSGGALELNGFSTAIGQISGSGNIRNTGAADAVLTVDTSVLGDSSFAGVIENGGPGTLSLVKTGAGTLKLRTGSYTGATLINGGRLIVDGWIGGSTFTVGNGTTLGGSGTVGTLNVGPGGRVSPGNSIGTINVSGDLTFSPGSVYDVEVDPAGNSSDLIAATGTAFLNDAVLHIGLSGAYQPSSTYTILTAAGGIVGTFASATSNFAFLDATLAYGLNDVTLTLTRNATGFVDVAETRNQRATATGAEQVGSGHAAYDAIAGLDAAGARTAFDALSGEFHASAKTVLIEDSRFVRNAAMDRVREAFNGSYRAGFTGWGHVFGSWGDTDGDGNASGLKRETGGLLVGIDGVILDGWRLGVIAGYGQADFHSSRAASGESDNSHLGIYGGTQWGSLGLRGGAAYAWHDVEMKRLASFPGFSDRVSSEYDAGTAQVFGELGYRFEGPVSFEPFAGLAYVNLDTDSYNEAGGAAALAASSSDTGGTFSTLGLRASTRFMLSGVNATARGLIGWRHAFGDTTPLAIHGFAGGDLFTVAGVPITDDTAIIEAGLDFSVAANANLGLSYSGQLSPDAQDHGLKADLLVRF